METLLAILIFFLGAIIGSFLNVVILRYRSGKTLGGRSMCFTCGTTLSWYELVPIGSYLTQRGRCAHCRAPIAWQYPAVETLVGFLFVALFFRFEYLLFSTPLLFGILFAYYAIVISYLVVLSVYDLRHKILPDKLSFAFGLVAFIGMFFISGDSLVLHLPSLSHFAAGFILPAPFCFLWLVSKGKWMGLGDAKLMIGIGFLLGLTAGATALLISFWMGALVGILMLILAPLVKKRVHIKTEIPFGPFLALGAVIVLLCRVDFQSLMMLFG